MSYSVYIYHRSVKAKVEQGLELDAFEHEAIPQADMARFLERLAKYGYRKEASSGVSTEFVKDVAGCPVQVAVFATEIAFSVPYWKHSPEAIAEALQDASELSDSEATVLFNPQTDGWAE